MRSRLCLGAGRPSDDTKASGRRVTLQGTIGPRGRSVEPLRGFAHSHPPGYSQRGRGLLRSSLPWPLEPPS